MPNLEYLISSNSRDFKYGCLQPWEREIEDKPLEKRQMVYIEEAPPDEYTEPEQKPYDPYEPRRGVVVIPL